MPRRQLVLLVHGIRDIARWQSEIASALERHGFAVELTNYGRMNLLEFLIPVPFFRQRATSKIWTQMQHAMELHPHFDISVIAHSFGTYITPQTFFDDNSIFLLIELFFVEASCNMTFHLSRLTTDLSPDFERGWNC